MPPKWLGCRDASSWIVLILGSVKDCRRGVKVASPSNRTKPLDAQPSSSRTGHVDTTGNPQAVRNPL